ncbi:MAG TPA: AMP-binding protein [Candidatus Dormibacteraeota bacterium]|nr:AMP-binding protein [Candidatus Dormibacteraeota bacterium]
MTDILAMHAAATPDKVAVITDAGETRTFAQLNARANRVASMLLGLGVRPGDRSVGMQYNSVHGPEIGHALRKLQCVSTPMNYRLRGEEIAYLLNDSGARVVFAGPEFIEHIDAARPQVEDTEQRTFIAVIGDAAPPPGWESYERLLAGAGEDEPDTPSEITGPTMIYTAGTTGNPKGAFRPKGADPAVVFQWIDTFGLRNDDVHLLAGPGYHSAPGAFAGLQQIIGATLVVMRHFDPVLALQLIDRHRVTSTFMAPILVKRIVDLPDEVKRQYDVSSMRALLVGAAPFPGDVKRRAAELFGDSVYEFYGATETGIVTVIGPSELLSRPESCGRPLPGVEVRLVDDEGNDVGVGTPGELWARSAATFGEYLNKPQATQSNFHDGFFTVGDVAYRDEEGYIYICDRKVDMIISGGVNVYPAEVEAVLHRHPDVEDCAVIGVPDPEWGEAIKAVVKRREGSSLTEQEVLQFLGERVADYKRPRSVDFVDEFPRDAAGKLLKRLLRDRYWEAAGRRI